MSFDLRLQKPGREGGRAGRGEVARGRHREAHVALRRRGHHRARAHGSDRLRAAHAVRDEREAAGIQGGTRVDRDIAVAADRGDEEPKVVSPTRRGTKATDS